MTIRVRGQRDAMHSALRASTCVNLRAVSAGRLSASRDSSPRVLSRNKRRVIPLPRKKKKMEKKGGIPPSDAMIRDRFDHLRFVVGADICRG